MAITCKEIAARVGVSRQAVYSVLGNKSVCHVSADKREQILHLAKAYHYKPNHAAVRLNGKPTRTIGVIMDGLTNVGGLRLMRLSTRLYLEGYTLQSVLFSGTAQACDAIGNFIAAGVDAVVFPYVMLEQLSHEDICIPAVILGREIEVDYAFGTELTTRHLIEVHGHRRILMLATELLYGAVAKYRGYQHALEENGLEVLPALETIGNHHFEAQLLNYLKRGVTAIVTGGDVFAAQLINFLRARGIRVPEDVAVTGFDGIGTHPELTSAIDPLAETAAATAELVLEKIRGNVLTTVPPRLIRPGLCLGSSCGCPPVKQPHFAYSYERI